MKHVVQLFFWKWDFSPAYEAKASLPSCRTYSMRTTLEGNSISHIKALPAKQFCTFICSDRLAEIVALVTITFYLF